MKKQYIEPKNKVIEVETASLIAESPGPGYGDGPGSGNVGAKESIWDWGWDEGF